MEGEIRRMCRAFEDLAQKRVAEEKKALACHLIARGKQTLEEIAEDADLPIEEVRDLAGLQLARKIDFVIPGFGNDESREV